MDLLVVPVLDANGRDNMSSLKVKVKYLHEETPQFLPELLVHSSCYWASPCTSLVLWSAPVGRIRFMITTTLVIS